MRHKRPEQPPVNSQQNPVPPRDKEDEKRMKQHERELRREHHRARRWRYVASVLIILLALVIIALLLCMMFDYNPFDKTVGNGSGGGNGIVNTNTENSTGNLHENEESTASPTPTETVQKDTENNGPQTITIRIDSDRIYVGDDQCEDAQDMKNKIMRLSYAECIFILDSSKGTVKRYDEVRRVLDDLEDALGIKVTELDY